MEIQGSLYDYDTQEGLAGVSVGVCNSDGQYVGPGTTTNVFGEFSLDNPVLTPNGNFFLLFTSVGYEPVMVDPSVFIFDSSYPLVKSEPSLLDDFIVSVKKTSSGWFPLIAVAAAIFVISKMSASGKR
jgi:hypothetical protein